MNKPNDVLYSTCVLCNKQFPKSNQSEISLCSHCMALLIQSIDIFPEEDYPVFLDYAYQAKDRLVSGEDIKSIAKDAPDGFKKWLVKNAKKTGFAITSDHVDYSGEE
jgi:hypothetical protein